MLSWNDQVSSTYGSRHSTTALVSQQHGVVLVRCPFDNGMLEIVLELYYFIIQVAYLLLQVECPFTQNVWTCGYYSVFVLQAVTVVVVSELFLVSVLLLLLVLDGGGRTCSIGMCSTVSNKRVVMLWSCIICWDGIEVVYGCEVALGVSCRNVVIVVLLVQVILGSAWSFYPALFFQTLLSVACKAYIAVEECRGWVIWNGSLHYFNSWIVIIIGMNAFSV